MPDLKIRNWDKWQSYRKDRGQPPWIKVHRCVMRNPEWVSLTDAERGQLVAIWLLAADRNGVIPASPELIQKLCYMDGLPDLNKFSKLGFIDECGCQLDANLTPDGRQHDQPEKSRVDKNRKEYSASNDAVDNVDFLKTKRKRKLNGKRWETFQIFWDAFGYKKGKREAADAWLDIPSLTNELVEIIVGAARMEAERRPQMIKDGKTPKMAQGWISASRWEDEEYRPPKKKRIGVPINGG